MSEYIIEIPDEYFASYDTKRDMYYPDERDSAMPIIPIVRCRDCKHCCEERRNTALGWTDKPICLSDQWSTSGLKPCHEVEPDGFCKWGERRAG